MSDVSAGREVGAAEIASLLERIQAGDREAFMTIIRLYQQKVFVMAYSILRDREDALDAVQETFLRLYQKAGLYKPGKSFQGWLLQMAKNISIDSYRNRPAPRSSATAKNCSKKRSGAFLLADTSSTFTAARKPAVRACSSSATCLSTD